MTRRARRLPPDLFDYLAMVGLFVGAAAFVAAALFALRMFIR